MQTNYDALDIDLSAGIGSFPLRADRDAWAVRAAVLFPPTAAQAAYEAAQRPFLSAYEAAQDVTEAARDAALLPLKRQRWAGKMTEAELEAASYPHEVIYYAAMAAALAVFVEGVTPLRETLKAATPAAPAPVAP